MTVSTELSHEEYTGNGVTTDFDFRFRIFEAKHLVVSVADQDGAERILTNGTDYTLRGVGSYRGGKVILKMPLATGWKIGIARDLPAVQETDLRNQGKFFAEVHEDAFDYLTMLIQKSLGYLSLCLRKPSFISDHYDAKSNKISNLGKPVKDGDAVDLGTMKEHVSAKDKRSLRVADKDIPALPNAANRANKLLSFDNNGNPVVIVPESGSAADVLAELGSPDFGRGDSLVAVKQPFTGAVARTQHDKNTDTLSVKDFGAIGDGVADDTEAFANAPALSYVPNGSYLITGTINKTFISDGGVALTGNGASTCFVVNSDRWSGNKNDSYTDIKEGAVGLRKICNSLAQDVSSVVITGDSLSFNGFGYPPEIGAMGAAYATQNPFGLSSWAHLIRDSIFTSHSSFSPVEDCCLVTSASVSYPFVGASGNLHKHVKNYGINAKVAFLSFTAGDSATLSNKYTGWAALIVSLVPAAYAVTFKVGGITYNNAGDPNKYQGYGYMIVPAGVINKAVTITEVQPVTPGAPAELPVYGLGSTGMTVPHLTGKGAWTSGQILNEFDSLVSPYAPSVVYYIIGANDIGATPIQTVASNVRNFIDRCKSLNPACHIILLTTPPCSSYSRETAKSYIRAMRVVADATDSSIIDLWSELESVPVNEWRFDNIHFTTEGDNYVFDIVRKLTLPTININPDRFTPVRECYLGVGGLQFLPTSANTLIGVFTSPAGKPKLHSTYPYYAGSAFVASYNGDYLDISCPVGYYITSVEYVGDNTHRLICSSIESERQWLVSFIDGSGNKKPFNGIGVYWKVTAMRVGK